MKKQIIIITILIAIAFASCIGRNQGLKKLPRSISWDFDSFVFNVSFEYDRRGRIVKMTKNDFHTGSMSTTITYKGRKSVVFETPHGAEAGVKNYMIKGNTVTLAKVDDHINSTRMTLDKKGYVTELFIEYIHGNENFQVTYLYEKGNLTYEIKEWYRDGAQTFRREFNYRHDDKKSPFTNSNTPKWVLKELLGDYSWTDITPFVSANNIIGLDVDDITYDFDTDYDEQGYLTTITTPTKLSRRLADITISYSDTPVSHPMNINKNDKFDDKLWYTAPGTEIRVTISTPEVERQFQEIALHSDRGNYANQRLIFSTTKPEGIEITFVAVEMDYDQEKSEFYFKEVYPIATEKITPNRAMTVDWLEAGLMPTRAVSFVDESGQNRYFGISGDNSGPEEPGFTPHRLTEYPGPRTQSEVSHTSH